MNKYDRAKQILYQKITVLYVKMAAQNKDLNSIESAQFHGMDKTKRV